jgi:hypothetical protein
MLMTPRTAEKIRTKATIGKILVIGVLLSAEKGGWDLVVEVTGLIVELGLDRIEPSLHR